MDGYTDEEWIAYQTDPVSFCINELGNPDDNIRFNAVDILRGMGRDGEAAIGPLSIILKNDVVGAIRAQAAFALIELGYIFKDRAAVAVAPLIEALTSDPFPETRSLSAIALGNIGVSAITAIPALETACAVNDNEELREAASEALKRLRIFEPI